MGSKKVTKQTKNFTRKHLTHTLTTRKKHQAKKKLTENRQHLKALKRGNKKNTSKQNDEDEDDDSDDDSVTEPKPKMDMSVDALLNAQGLDSDDGSDDDEEEEEGESDGKEDDDDDDLESIGSSEDGSGGKMDLEILKEKDPDFYKFLQENDKGLLEFDQNDEPESEDEDQEEQEQDDDDDDEDNDENMDPKKTKSIKTVVLTKELLRTWQKAILENRSMRALRKLLLAFKSAAFSSSNDNSTNLPFSIESSSVYNALINTTLRYLPVFLNQSLPARELPNGKFKIANNSKMYATMQRILKSYFSSLTELISQIPSQEEKGDSDSMLHTSISQSSKLTPWIIGNRKIMKTWIKTLLDLWASSSDQVRVATILSLRRIAVASDSSTMESIMKGVYTGLIRSAKNTTVFSLPLINLMKNSGSGLFLVNTETSYPIVFSYIRQLAIHLRNSMKLKSKEGFQAVYNWQYIHSLDFWSLVLSSACEKNNQKGSSKSHESNALQPLIYPLVQITIGVIKLIPTSRYYPLRLHCIRLLMRIIQRTGTFIPLTPFLLDMIDSPLFKKQANPSSLKALDFEYLIRCPKSHENSRVYSDNISEEVSFLILEYHSLYSTSISFPELVLPALITLKKFIKSFNKHPKLISNLKVLIDKLELNKTFIEEKRSTIGFGPKDRIKTLHFLSDFDSAKSPLGNHFRLQSKLRNQKLVALNQAAHKHIVD
ncbi:hypothetical protein Pst134EB_018679 [Puccinia striiformis f. sp. tritici]|nr:hypothetical protein Pst134EB_018679 [Puccinia striiformis f. sp. tritici]